MAKYRKFNYYSRFKQKNKRLYGVWAEMMTRCYNPTREYYGKYGGKNIFVCEEWHCYDNFYIWAVSNGYKEEISERNRNKWTLDRIDNTKGYSPENCHWTDAKTQCYNRSNTKRYDYNGKIYTSLELATLAGLPPHIMRARLQKMTVDKALSLPYAPRKNIKKQNNYPVGYISTTQIVNTYEITEKQLKRMRKLGKLSCKQFGNTNIFLEIDIKKIVEYFETVENAWGKYRMFEI